MADEAEAADERKKIEEYLKLYAMEEVLDEIVNGIIVDMPINPYMAIAASMEAKTMCEIISIALNPVVVGANLFGVEATVVTNITAFKGVACYSSRAEQSELDEIRDYETLKTSIEDIILELDPTNIAKVDEVISGVPGIDNAESMAISIACCRAAARHKAIKPFQFFSELMGIDWKKKTTIPVPIVSVLSRVSEDRLYTQNISLVVTTDKTESFAGTLNKIMVASRAVARHESMRYPSMVSNIGCIAVDNETTLIDAMKIVKSALQECNAATMFKMGVNLSANKMLMVAEGEEEISSFVYKMDKGTAPPLEPAAEAAATPAKGKGKAAPAAAPAAPTEVSGVELVDHINALWMDTDIVTIENSLHPEDSDGLKALKEKIGETVSDIRQAKTGKLNYALSGVGSDNNCNLQVTIDGTAFLAIPDADIPTLLQDTPYNTVKLQLCTLANISAALAICKKAKKCKMAIIAAVSDTSEYPETPDTILSDLAVGFGAKQLSAGGMAVGECCSKYNRVLEIVEESGESGVYVGAGFRVDKS